MTERLGPDEQRKLAALARAGDLGARDKLVAANMGFVWQVARSYARKYASEGLQAEDLVSEGVMGVMHAVGKFEPERGVAFLTYASQWVRSYVARAALHERAPYGGNEAAIRHVASGKLQREREALLRGGATEEGAVETLVREHKLGAPVVRAVLSLRRAVVSIDAPAGDDEGPSWHDRLADDSASPEERLDAERTRAQLRDALGALGRGDARFEKILEGRLLAEEPRTLQEIGDELGLSKERVRQLEVALLKRIGRYVRARGRPTSALRLASGEVVRLVDLAARSGRSESNIRNRLARGMAPDEAAFGRRRAPQTKFDLRLFGERVSVAALARTAHLSDVAVRRRLHHGMTPEEVVTIPVRAAPKGRRVDLLGEGVTVRHLARLARVSTSTVRRHLGRGRSPAEIVAEPRARPGESMVGRVFGRMTVSGQRGRWCQCRCSCGAERTVARHDLLRGKVVSCGCLRRDRARLSLRRGVDLTGRVFGRLRVVGERILRRPGGHAERAWDCECSCGGEIMSVRTGSLVRGATRSCGCLRRRGAPARLQLAADSGLSLSTVYRRVRGVCGDAPSALARLKPGPKRGSTLHRYTLHGRRITLAEISELAGLSVKTVVEKLRGQTVEQLVGQG